MLLYLTLIPQHYYKLNSLSIWAAKSCQESVMSEFSLILVLRKENKQNSDITWQRYKLNLRNSLLFAEIFNATFLFGLNDPFKPFAKLRFFYFYSKYLDERQSRMSSNEVYEWNGSDLNTIAKEVLPENTFGEYLF